MKNEKLLPLGSVVLLEEGMQKLVIVGRGSIYIDPNTKKEAFSDYVAVLYPSGLDLENTIFFEHENNVAISSI